MKRKVFNLIRYEILALRALAAFEYSGTKDLQWPHQGAKNSTIQIPSLCRTSLSKFDGVSSTTSEDDGYRAQEPWTIKTTVKMPVRKTPVVKNADTSNINEL